MREVEIKLENGADLPQYQTEKSSGMDLCAWKYSFPDNLGKVYDFKGEVLLESLDRILVKTGISCKLLENLEFQVRPRSGLSIKNGIVAQLGTIDEDYTGDIGLIIINLSKEPFIIKKGDRLGQIVACNVEKVKWKVVDKLEKNLHRGNNGFGHTGK